ncbi:PREDICTED: arrestin domain-containing protein 3-like [Cyprinodon variegatus]|uniref:Arrestin domain-containing protein 3-like n=1 Tax=Cyprinodon variegatus TaxID=28743 RepID=A0A3Q2DIN7_CYPVA|nr:PREDICTED: arrestin domain-containing protein 3-like [Cyprinodon variegatus]
MTIKHFKIEYDAINSRNIFTNGDTINGRIILEASKKTKIQSLVFIAKGKALVRLVNYYGDIISREDVTDDYFQDKLKYYRIKQDIVKEGEQDGREVIEKGRHVFPFSFKIPNSRKIPSSFSSIFGQIVHTLKAELKQSKKLRRKAKTHFTFMGTARGSRLMARQHESVNKNIVLGSGKVTMDVHTRRSGYKQGEVLRVKVEIQNLSSRSVKAKFVLYEIKTFFGPNRGKIQKHEIQKEKSDAIESQSGQTTVIKEMIIPRELSPSILNCSLIRLEYMLKVYLEIPCETDLVVKLPIVIIPELSREGSTSGCSRSQTFASRNQPAWMSQSMEPPPSYEESAMYPLYPFGDL